MGTTRPIKDLDQIKKFRNYYIDTEYKPRNYALLVVGLNSALRISDLLSLRWQDVCDGKSFRKHIIIVEKKTGKENVIAINRSAAEALFTYYQTLDHPSLGDYIFESRKVANKPIDRYQAYRIIRKAAVACGLGKNISCHSLRKTFGYHAWQNGVPPAMLMSIFNHSSYNITRRYLGIEQDDKDKVFRTISL